MICPACQYKLHNASQNCAGICCRVKQPCNHEGKLNQTTKVCHNGLCAFLCEGPQIEWITVSGAMEQQTTQVWASDDTWGSPSYRWPSCWALALPSCWPAPPCSAPCASLRCILYILQSGQFAVFAVGIVSGLVCCALFGGKVCSSVEEWRNSESI